MVMGSNLAQVEFFQALRIGILRLTVKHDFSSTRVYNI
jgi:hypothetical protein